jgi:hypothetical protein
MENKKSRKIGLTILGFFLQFSIIFGVLLEKEKDKEWTVPGPISAQAAQHQRENARAPAGKALQKSPQGFG